MFTELAIRGRQTGKTTTILTRAVLEAERGKNVVIFVENYRRKLDTMRVLDDFLTKTLEFSQVDAQNTKSKVYQLYGDESIHIISCTSEKIKVCRISLTDDSIKCGSIRIITSVDELTGSLYDMLYIDDFIQLGIEKTLTLLESAAHLDSVLNDTNVCVYLTSTDEKYEFLKSKYFSELIGKCDRVSLSYE